MRCAAIRIVMLCAVLSLTACGKSDDEQQSHMVTQPQAQVAPSQPAVSTQQQPQQQATLDQPVTAPSTANYTFRGNVLLPPDAYLNSNTKKLDDINVCGVLSLDQPTPEKYCFKFKDLHSHLYDSDHAALDVWDVRDNWFLLLSKEDKRRELWVDKTKFGVYHPYADIIKQKLLFLGDWNYKNDPTWPLQAYDGPDGNPIELSQDRYPETKSKSPMIAITSVAQSPKKELWFKINLINNLCEAKAQDNLAPVVMDIWFPAYRLDDETGLYIPTVWYFAKGC